MMDCHWKDDIQIGYRAFVTTGVSFKSNELIPNKTSNVILTIEMNCLHYSHCIPKISEVKIVDIPKGSFPGNI